MTGWKPEAYSSDCRVCAEKPHGAWPKWHVGTHCRDCHTSWRGVAAAHTLCCHLTFSSNNAADKHLVKGHCTDPATIPTFEAVVRSDGNMYWTPLSGVIGRDYGDVEADEAPEDQAA